MKCQWVSNSNVFFLLQQFSVVFVDMCCSFRSKCTTTSLWCRGRAACHEFRDSHISLSQKLVQIITCPGNFHTEQVLFDSLHTCQGLLVLPTPRCWSCWRPYSLKLPLPGHQCGEVCCRRIDYKLISNKFFGELLFVKSIEMIEQKMHFCLVFQLQELTDKDKVREFVQSCLVSASQGKPCMVGVEGSL